MHGKELPDTKAIKDVVTKVKAEDQSSTRSRAVSAAFGAGSNIHLPRINKKTDILLKSLNF